MATQHHPDDATLLAYAAGTLNEGFSLVVAAHLQVCARCAEQVEQAEALGGALLRDMEIIEAPSVPFDDFWRTLEGVEPEPIPEKPRPRADGLPDVLTPYIGDSLETIRWHAMAPGIRQVPLPEVRSDNGSVRLLAIDPGVALPHHSHRGNELTLVLQGEYRDETGNFTAGDLADLDDTVAHQPEVVGDEPCICLIATDDRLRFTGGLSRLLQPLLRI